MSDRQADQFRPPPEAPSSAAPARLRWAITLTAAVIGLLVLGREAIAAYRDATDAGGCPEIAYYELYDLEKALKATQAYQDSVRNKPAEVAEHHNLKGIALGYQGKEDEAIAEFREAVRLRPNFVDAHLNLGRALRRQRMSTEAIAEFLEATRLDPANVSARDDLKALREAADSQQPQ